MGSGTRRTHRDLGEVDSQIWSLILLDSLNFNVLCCVLKVATMDDDCVRVGERVSLMIWRC